jgi:mono/diheme cytochrome c family protein
MQKLINIPIIVSSLAAALFAGHVYAGGGKPYTVKCEGGTCMVDEQTYEGQRRFEGTCGLCHGSQGVGGVRGPALTTENGRLEGMNYDHFQTVVLYGLKGDVGVMPAFRKDPNIKPYIPGIWSYLQAVQDGAIKGELEQMGEGKKKYPGWE